MKMRNLLLAGGLLFASCVTHAAMMLELKPTSPTANSWFDAISIQLPPLTLSQTEQQSMNIMGRELLFSETLTYQALDAAVGQVHLNTFCGANGLVFAGNACHQASLHSFSELKLQQTLVRIISDSISYRSSITVAFSSFNRWYANDLYYELLSNFKVSAFLPDLISGPLPSPAVEPNFAAFINIPAESTFEPVQISHSLTIKNAQDEILSQRTHDAQYLYDTELTIRQVNSPSPAGILLLCAVGLGWYRRRQA
jgi:hypothetical protein